MELSLCNTLHNWLLEKAMGNRLEYLFEQWFDQKDSCQWVLATIVETKGSAYRKAGARMLINSNGQVFGLLSGGCLESDLMLQAQKCWSLNKDIIIVYDMQDETDITWQLGIGCGGMVKVLLQSVNSSNNYLELLTLREKLNNRCVCFYQQTPRLDLHEINKSQNAVKINLDINNNNQLEYISNDSLIFTSIIKPRPAIAIMGGGADALPLVNIAYTLGWHITLFDPRVNYARRTYFKHANQIIKKPFNELYDCDLLNNANVIIVMSHNVNLDAQALLVADKSNASYLGLLGPKHRTLKVLEKANIEYNQINKPLFNPVGLNLGGELPESIALSILSEAHAFLEKKLGNIRLRELQKIE